MNKERRGNLRAAIDGISRAIDIIENAKDDEADCLANMPENLQSSERYMTMEDAIDHLEDALSNLEEARNDVEAAMG